MGWGRKLAKIWLNYVPPSRPSNSELVIYTNYLRDLQKKLNRKVEVLVLGSTTEFRDWGFEELLNVTVIDYSYDYYLESLKYTKYRNKHEFMIHKRWQDMDFENKFDIILGDCVIGNLQPHELENFLYRASQSLKKEGLFMTKNYFRNGKRIKSLEEIMMDYYTNYTYCHPLSKLMYDLNMTCMDQQQEQLNFQNMYSILYDGYKNGLIKKEEFEKFSKLGIQKELTFKHYIPTFSAWENMTIKYFKNFKKEYGDDIFSHDFPVYVLHKT